MTNFDNNLSDEIPAISEFNAIIDIDEEQDTIGNDFFDDIDKIKEITEFLNNQTDIEIAPEKDSIISKLNFKNLKNLKSLKSLKLITSKAVWRKKAKAERNHRRKLEINRIEAVKYLDYLQKKLTTKKNDYEALQKKIIKIQENHINIAEHNKKIFENYNKLQNKADMLEIENKDLKLKLKDSNIKFNNCHKYINKLEAKYKILFKNNHSLNQEIKRVNNINAEQTKMIKVMNSEHKDIMAKTEVFVNEYFKLKFMNETQKEQI